MSNRMMLLGASLMLSSSLATMAAAQTPLSPAPGQPPSEAAVTSGTSAAPAAESDGGLEDIVVTARRTEESLQTTPVAVTALGTEAIRQAQIVDSVGLQRVAPSLSVSTGSAGGSGFANIAIRGAGTLNPGVANDPSVATYLDGVYIPRPSQGITDLIDIQRVEVLRGPQGTLFGRNTTGGALNVISADPNGNWEGQIRAQAGNYKYRNIGGILNVPIMGDELAARFVYDFTDRDGFGNNVSLNLPSNDRNSHYARAKLRWAPDGSDWSITISGDYNRIKDHGQFVGLAAYLPTANAAIGRAGNLDQFLHTKANWYTNYSIPFTNNFTSRKPFRGGNAPYDDLKAYGGQATISGKFGEIDVTSVSAYRYSLAIGLNELDGVPFQILGSESYYASKQYSEELRFSGQLGDRLTYIFGGYFSTEKGAESSLAQTFGLVAVAPNFGFTQNLSDVKNRSVGVFGQANYNITDELRFTGGLRWTWDKRSVVIHNLTNVFNNTCSAEITSLPGFTPPCSFPRDAKFDYPAWTVGLDYRANDDVFIYLKSSSASKAGGFNIRNGSAGSSIPPFDPEKVTDVEGGLKMTSPDRRLRANVAVFYSWQDKVQRNAAALVAIGNVLTSTQYLLNAGKQHVYGAEFEFSAVPWEGMTINANASLLNGEYVAGSFTEVRDIPGIGLPGCTAVPGNATASRCIVDRSNENVPQLPKVQFNIGVTQKLPVSFGEFTLHGNYSYIGKQSFDTQTADPRQSVAAQAITRRLNALGEVPGYGLFDGRVALQLENPNLEFFAFAKNIGGKKYITRTFNNLYSSLGVAFEYIGAPFTFGAGATFRFGP